MSFAGTLITVGVAALGYWVVRSVMQAPEDAAVSAARPPPQPDARKAPGPASARRSAANQRNAPRRPGAQAPSTTRPPNAPEFDWYILLDVPSDAGRAEIREALRRRISRARANGDGAEVAALLHAASVGMRSPVRRRPPGPRTW